MQNDPRSLRTNISMQGLDLAQAFSSTLGRFHVAPAGYRPELMAPEGQSTGGGEHALQRIRLVGPDASHPAIVVGSCNIAQKQATLRTFDHIAAIHQKRFGVPVPLDPSSYAAFLEAAKNYFLVGRIEITWEQPSSSLSPPSMAGAPVAAPSSGVDMRIVFALVGVVVLLLVVIVALALR